jgi:hypothetical protein
MLLCTGSDMTAGTLFCVTVSQGPRVSVQCIVVNIRFLLTICKEAAGNGFVCLTNTYHM